MQLCVYIIYVYIFKVTLKAFLHMLWDAALGTLISKPH